MSDDRTRSDPAYFALKDALKIANRHIDKLKKWLGDRDTKIEELKAELVKERARTEAWKGEAEALVDLVVAMVLADALRKLEVDDGED
jgi:hypothetical protein